MKINMRDKTAGTHDDSVCGVTYFFRSKYADGCILAFYSHSPWGRVNNQSRGWVVIDPKTFKVVDTCETFDWGAVSHLGQAYGDPTFAEWKKLMKEEHGRTVETYRSATGEYLWTMKD